MISDSSNIARLRSTFSFLDQPDDPLYQRFMQRASLVQLHSGDYVCHEGRACEGLALVTRGQARVYKLGENGREITLYRVGPGESCILTASCILSDQPFPAFAMCETAVEAVVVPAGEVTRWLAESPAWRDYVFSLVSRRLADVISVVEEVVFRRMDRRVAGYLTERTGDGGAAVHATHQQIASDLGTSREVVSRLLKELEGERLIRVGRGEIEVLDHPGLATRALEA